MYSTELNTDYARQLSGQHPPLWGKDDMASDLPPLPPEHDPANYSYHQNDYPPFESSIGLALGDPKQLMGYPIHQDGASSFTHGIDNLSNEDLSQPIPNVGDEKDQQRLSRSEIMSLAANDSSHLFWVPAEQHPEIAPGEFEKFLKLHSSVNRQRNSLKRRSSILAKSFSPGEEAEASEQQDNRDAALEALERGRPTEEGEQEEAQKEPRNRARMRRSISLDTATKAEQVVVPDFLVFDRNSSPLDESQVLLPKADRSKLLRRGARTKFHRNSSYNSATHRNAQDRNARHTESMPVGPPLDLLHDGVQGITLSDGPLVDEPKVVESPVVPEQRLRTPSPPPPPSPPPTTPPLPQPQSMPPTPKPSASTPPTVNDAHMLSSPYPRTSQPPSRSQTPSPSPLEEGMPEVKLNAPEQRKSLWSRAFRSDDKPKKKMDVTPHEPPVPRPQPSLSTELPQAGKKFGLSSLFSRKNTSTKASSNVETSGALTSNVPRDFQLNKINRNRLPLHLERAIYRLSHIKLANSRRPLHEQVLISNLMFWYLSIVSQQNQQGPTSNGSPPHMDARQIIAANKKMNKRNPKKMSSASSQSPSPSPSPPPPPPSHSSQSRLPQSRTPPDTRALQQFTRESTGFVVPENYLRPGAARNNHSNSKSGRLSDDDNDDDGDGSDDSNSSSGDEQPSRTTHKRPPKHAMADDDLPLSMYRKDGV